MGDRGNVCIVDGESAVYLYTHWGGSELPEVIQGVIQRGQRLDDAPYLARIVLDHMRGEEDLSHAFERDAGYGISAHIIDNEYPVIVLDADRGIVRFDNPTRHGDQCHDLTERDGFVPREWSMAEYAAMRVEDLDRAFGFDEELAPVQS